MNRNGAALQAEPRARPPRWERRAKPGADSVALPRLLGWSYRDHTPIRVPRGQAANLARLENLSVALLLGPRTVPPVARPARARSARRCSRTRRSRSRDPDPDPDPDPDHPSLTAAPEREQCAHIAGSSVVALRAPAATPAPAAG